jgi:hypothetical protein
MSDLSNGVSRSSHYGTTRGYDCIGISWHRLIWWTDLGHEAMESVQLAWDSGVLEEYSCDMRWNAVFTYLYRVIARTDGRTDGWRKNGNMAIGKGIAVWRFPGGSCMV